MPLANARVNQLSEAATRWYEGYLDTLDAKDLAAYGGYLAEDCEFYFNHQGPVQGKAAVMGMLAGYWPSFGTLRHEPLVVLGTDREIALEALNHYTRLDGSEVTLRAVAFTARNSEGLVTSVRVYSDTSPLFGGVTH